MFSQQTLRQYDDVLASDKPTPGGGCTLAVVAAHACSLVEMSASVTLKKYGNDFEYSTQLEGCRKMLFRCRTKAYELADEDAQAFERILQAMRLPKTTDEQRHTRNAELQKQYHRAALVPLELMQLCQKAISCAENALPYLYEYVRSDCDIGLELLKKAIVCSVHNVHANTSLITDTELKQRLEYQAAELVKTI